MRSLLSVSIVVFCMILLGVVGCKNDDSSPTQPSNNTTSAAGTYSGIIAGGSESGSLTLTIAAAKVGYDEKSISAFIGVTGTLHPAGTTDTVHLIGTFNTSNDSLYIAGGTYVFLGKFSNGTLTGDYYGPNGTGSFTLSVTKNGTVSVFLGTYTSVSKPGNHGVLNMLVKGSTIAGLAVAAGDSSRSAFTGTVSGNTLTIHPAGYPTVLLATGTFNTGHTSASGTYDNHDGNTGNWSCAIVQ